MAEQESPNTPSASSRYRVRRRHESWAPQTPNTSSAPRFRVRVQSQPHLNAGSAQLPAQTGVIIDPFILNHRSEDVVNAIRSSSLGWNLELPPPKYRHGVSRSPKSGENTVAQLRQRVEQRPNQGEGEAGITAERYRDHRRSRSIRSTFVPVVPPKVGRTASDIETMTESSYVLPPFSFNPDSEHSAEQMCPSPVSKAGTQEVTLPVLQPTVYTGHYSFGPEPADERLHDDISPRRDEDTTVSQTGSDDGPDRPVDSLSGLEDGVSIIDFAYLYTTNLSSLPTSGKKHVRFASRSDHAPSAHYKSSSDDSTRSSTTDLIDLGEYNESLPVVRSYESRVEMNDDSSDSEKEELLLLPASVCMLQDMCPDGIVEDSDDEKDMLILPASSTTQPGSANKTIKQGLEPASAVDMENDEDQIGNQGEREGDLVVLPASVYTPPGFVISNSEEVIDDVHIVGASTAQECSGHEDTLSELPAQTSGPINQTDALPVHNEGGDDLSEPSAAEQVPLKLATGPFEPVDQASSRLMQKRRKFIHRLLGHAGHTERRSDNGEGETGPCRKSLGRRIGKRLGKGVLLLVMWKRW